MRLFKNSLYKTNGRAKIVVMSKGKSTKKQILDTAIRIASTQGIQGITIGKLAEATGMSKSGLFAHFEKKDNLQLEILKLASENFVETVFLPAFRKDKGENRILAMFENWMSYLNDGHALPGGSIFISASFELDDRPGELRSFVQKSQQDLISNISKAAMIAVEVGDFRKDLDAKEFAKKLYSYVLGYHHYKRMLNDPDADSFIRKVFCDLIGDARSANKKDKKINLKVAN